MPAKMRCCIQVSAGLACQLLAGFLLCLSGIFGTAQAQVTVAAAAPQAVAQTLDLPSPPGPPNLESGSVMFIGNATVLIRFAGFTILTDPNFIPRGDHAHLGYGLKSKRLTEPALTLDNLPPIDLIVLSHLHGDHFDQLVQEKLERSIPVITTHAASQALEQMNFSSRYPLAPWEVATVRKGGATLRITSMPARHGPALVSALLPETMGSMLEFHAGENTASYRIYISGDTLMFDDLTEIARRYPEIDLALVHLGGTRILNTVMVTMDAKQGARLIQLIAPHKAIPLHYNDYDVFKSSIEDFDSEIKTAELQQKIIYLKHGESYNFKGRSAATPSP